VEQRRATDREFDAQIQSLDERLKKFNALGV
jgi:hypothetical protein